MGPPARLVPPFNLPDWCHPSIRLRQRRLGSPNQCHPSVFWAMAATSSWGHPSVRHRQDRPGIPKQRKLGPPAGSRGAPKLCHLPAFRTAASWGHPPIRGPAKSGQSVPPPNPPAGSPGWCHLRMVPPVSSESQNGAGVPEWCHPAVGLQQGRPQSPKQSPKQCHPSVPIAANLVPPASPEGPTGATRRFVTPVRLRQIQPGSPKQCHPAFRLNSATRQFGGIMRILGS